MKEIVKNHDKVIIIGNGAVGSSYAFSLVTREIAQEVGIIDINFEKAEGDAMDLSDALVYTSPKKIYAAQYTDCSDADLIVITAGAPQKEGETRLDLVEKNLHIMKEIIEPIMASSFDGIILVASNPVDIMTQAAQIFSGLPTHQVFGSGTALDTARFRKELAQILNVDARNVHGYIMGEHGDSEFPVWSHTNIGGLSIFEWVKNNADTDELLLINLFFKVKNAAYEIIQRKGATYYGIAMTLARITKAIFNDEHAILPLSTYIDGPYDIYDTYIGVPAIVNRRGIVATLEIPLNESEHNKMQRSATTIQEVRKAAFEKLNIQ